MVCWIVLYQYFAVFVKVADTYRIIIWNIALFEGIVIVGYTQLLFLLIVALHHFWVKLFFIFLGNCEEWLVIISQ